MAVAKLATDLDLYDQPVQAAGPAKAIGVARLETLADSCSVGGGLPAIGADNAGERGERATGFSDDTDGGKSPRGAYT